MRKFLMVAALVAASLFWGAAAYACNVPNPNLNAPPFVDGCPVPASALNALVGIFPTGAAGNGTTDDSAAINAAVAQAAAAPSQTVLLQPKTYFVSSPIVLGSVALKGVTPLVQANQPVGAIILCNGATITSGACVTSGVSGAQAAGGNISDVAIIFNGTAAPNGTINLALQGHNGVCRNIAIRNAYTAVEQVNALATRCENVTTGQVSNIHFLQNGSPEFYVSHARMGLNGTVPFADPATSTAFIGQTGSDPNTFVVTDSQFNLGNQSPTYVLSMTNFTSEVNGWVLLSNDTFNPFTACQAFVHTDTTAYPDRFELVNSLMVNGATACNMFDVNNPTGLKEVVIANNTALQVNMNIDTGTTAEGGFNITNNTIVGTATLSSGAGTGVVGGSGVFQNNVITGAFTLQEDAGTCGSGGGCPWEHLELGGNQYFSTYTDNGTGSITAFAEVHSWTPALSINGTAITLSAPSDVGTWYRGPDGGFYFSGGFTVSNLNSASGNPALITNLPLTCRAFGNGAEGTTTASALSMTGITAPPVMIEPVQSSATAEFITGASTGVASMGASQFTSSSTIAWRNASCIPK